METKPRSIPCLMTVPTARPRPSRRSFPSTAMPLHVDEDDKPSHVYSYYERAPRATALSSFWVSRVTRTSWDTGWPWLGCIMVVSAGKGQANDLVPGGEACHHPWRVPELFGMRLVRRRFFRATRGACLRASQLRRAAQFQQGCPLRPFLSRPRVG